MTDKNRAISESIEPFESLPFPSEDGDEEERVSPKGAWYRETDCIELMYRLEIRATGPWLPKQWDTDENASAMLLERILDAGFQVIIDKKADEMPRGHTCVVVRKTRMSGTFKHAIDRKTAIRDAYHATLASKEKP